MNKKENTKDVLDKTDLSLLKHIQNDARISNSKLAEKINLSETPCWRRWKKLEDDNYIEEYRAILNHKKLGFSVNGFTQVSLGSHAEESTDLFEAFVADTDWIPMCHCITGGADYIVQIIAQDLDEYYERIHQLRRVQGVSALHSSISVKEIKSSNLLPLD
ncbi:Lrp/AsnC family transcriptional regulator [Psychromonas sp. KJ10-10]|uniref:Lrp/AsnC family transcriptional regulator n=1 Tax=Psychromonas sp. KJ10-10 TaxID=3391823 RepID=UPI0039B5B4E1